jgi:hypothetical protein
MRTDELAYIASSSFVYFMHFLQSTYKNRNNLSISIGYKNIGIVIRKFSEISLMTWRKQSTSLGSVHKVCIFNLNGIHQAAQRLANGISCVYILNYAFWKEEEVYDHPWLALSRQIQ